MGVVYLLIGIVLGIVLTLIVLKYYAPKLIIKEGVSKYSFNETIDRLVSAVERNNWRMPHVHDLKVILSKSGYDVKSVKVLEICKPEFAYQILSKDKNRLASSLLPCRIAVYEMNNGDVIVSRMRGKEVGSLFGSVIANTMDLAGSQSEKIIFDALL